ncbi:hypothetical protein JL720_14095 [Aureococcus anophagefferens]|nr:hypothetical protein JL720_14095 [Aureococcus anophagefferens]
MNVVAVTADIALAAPVLIWANASVSLVGPHTISGAGDHGLLRLALALPIDERVQRRRRVVGRAPAPDGWGRSLVIEDTVFEGTVSNYSGGAVWVFGGKVAAVGVTFDRCVAVVGGAVHLQNFECEEGVPCFESDLDLRRCTFSSCRATAGDGGGVNVVSAGRVTLGPGLVFRGNVAETGGGGGAYLRNISGSLVVRDAVFAENRCRSSGGGLFVEFQAPKPRVECARCPVEMARQPCAYAKNGTWRSWYRSSDVATVVGSTFVGNEANFSAGGLGVTGGVRMTSRILRGPGALQFTPFVFWSNSELCPDVKENAIGSLYPPFLVRTLSVGCEPCPRDSYTLGAGSWLGTERRGCLPCPYGACEAGGSGVVAKPGYKGEVAGSEGEIGAPSSPSSDGRLARPPLGRRRGRRAAPATRAGPAVLGGSRGYCLYAGATTVAMIALNFVMPVAVLLATLLLHTVASAGARAARDGALDEALGGGARRRAAARDGAREPRLPAALDLFSTMTALLGCVGVKGSRARLFVQADIACYRPWQAPLFVVAALVGGAFAAPLAALCLGRGAAVDRRLGGGRRPGLDLSRDIMAEPFERRHAAWGSVIGAQILAFACLAAQPWAATVRVLFMLSVSVAAALAHSHAMPFKSADTNYLQGALLTALPVFCALQLPWSVTSTINAPVGRDDKLPVIANRCAKCSLAILALPCAWAAAMVYQQRHVWDDVAARAGRASKWLRRRVRARPRAAGDSNKPGARKSPTHASARPPNRDVSEAN